jgi:hypothetical protein
MNDDDLREALRPPGDIEPLDPARVIAGARRRRRRSLATGGAAAVAVLAVAGAGVFAGSRPTGLPVVEQSTPTTSTAKPSRTTPSATPQVDLDALTAQCKSALRRDQELVFGPATGRRASLSSPQGTLIVVADSKHWAACDSGYRPIELSVRKPAAIRRPALSDTDAFAVASNAVTKAGKSYDYYWAAGLLPAGVTAINYIFPGGTTAEAVVSGNYWMLQHWIPGASLSPQRVRVQLIGSTGAVLKTFTLKPGEQTCAQISHGC